MPRYHVEILQPTSLLSEVGNAQASFERIWAGIPKNRPRRLWHFLPEQGLFVKGRMARWNLSRSNYMRSRRLFTERRALAGLAALGLPVPEVVAVGVERRAGIATRSWLMLRLFEHAVDLERYLLDGLDAPGSSRRQAVLEAVGRLVAQLHGAHAYHRDLSTRNVLLRLDADVPQTYLIDCPNAKLAPLRCTEPKLRRGDLFRITRSCRRNGATPEEIEQLLVAAEAPDRPHLHAAVDRSLESGGRRLLRNEVWMVTGR